MNNPVILKNEYLTVKLSEKGASICEISDTNGEIISCGGPTILFPVCGGVYKNEIMLGKNSLSIPDNGFAKDSNFTLLECYEDYAQFMLVSDDELAEVYPFSFNLVVSYKLLGNALEITVKAGNFSEYKMPYSAGINLSFSLYEQMNLDFENDEILEGYVIKENLFRGEVKRLMPQNGKCVPLKNNEAFIMKNIISDSFTLRSGDEDIVKIIPDGTRNIMLRKDKSGVCMGMWRGTCGTYGKKTDLLKAEQINFADARSSDEFSCLAVFKY